MEVSTEFEWGLVLVHRSWFRRLTDNEKSQYGCFVVVIYLDVASFPFLYDPMNINWDLDFTR